MYSREQELQRIVFRACFLQPHIFSLLTNVPLATSLSLFLDFIEYNTTSTLSNFLRNETFVIDELEKIYFTQIRKFSQIIRPIICYTIIVIWICNLYVPA